MQTTFPAHRPFKCSSLPRRRTVSCHAAHSCQPFTAATGPLRRGRLSALTQHPQHSQQRDVSTRAASGALPSEGSSSESSEPVMKQILSFPSAFWKFLRPHTIRGTILGTTAVTARALMENSYLIDWDLLPRAILGLIALLCGNGFIVGINQLYDVDIDAISKPFLPVAAGEMSPIVGWVVVVALAAAGVGIVASNFGQFITSLYCFGLTLGTIYSVPPLRLKRFPIMAFCIIATVRGFLLNFGVYYATRAALGLSFEWSAAISFITVFVTIFATAIAITKDLPDVEGDQANNITTFATVFGVKNISLLGAGLLMANYVGAIGLAITMPQTFNVPLMAGAHAVLLVTLVYRTLALHAQNYTRIAIIEFYRWVWNLFYAEYFLLPFI